MKWSFPLAIATAFVVITATNTDLVVIGPSSHMVYLAETEPHGDERPVLLMISPTFAGFLMPSLMVFFRGTRRCRSDRRTTDASSRSPRRQLWARSRPGSTWPSASLPAPFRAAIPAPASASRSGGTGCPRTNLFADDVIPAGVG